MITGNFTVLTTTEAGSCAPLLFDSDGTNFVVDNAANTSVCNNSRLFIGTLIDYNVSLDTTNGNRGISLKVRMGCIQCLETRMREFPHYCPLKQCRCYQSLN